MKGKDLSNCVFGDYVIMLNLNKTFCEFQRIWTREMRWFFNKCKNKRLCYVELSLVVAKG